MSTESALADLTARVFEKYAAAWQAAWPLPDDPLEWWSVPPAAPVPPLPPGWPQFPRERWVIYPLRRTYCLILADHAIDHGRLAEAGFLIQYGGMDRIS
ncbi:hypothetical protein [Nocardia wallacei]|uniref:hypothetical protein n=1 Tax=Nocardia wallacei TaxID=480035 RepID=UPI002454A629|nr:hypothetical protein [Nocardia wallacei]